MADFPAADALLAAGVQSGAFPAAAVEIGRTDGPLWQAAYGRLAAGSDAADAAIDTVFDLASLTKVVATTTLAMRAVDQGRLDIDAPLRARLPLWRGDERSSVTAADLLAHAGGLTAHLPFYRDYRGRTDYEPAISTLPLEYAPRSAAIYSDLGFILLGFLLEDVCGVALDTAFGALVGEQHWGDLAFRPPRAWRARTAPTEFDDWRGRLLVGEVHDENAWALGGVAGHAGLFGTVRAVGRFARAVAAGFQGRPTLAAQATFDRFTTRTRVPGSSRALGWDTMLSTSSCGRRMSPRAIGHTGFTGTSLWIDPEADVYVVLLTNRVHPTRANQQILAVRPALHDAVMEALT